MKRIRNNFIVLNLISVLICTPIAAGIVVFFASNQQSNSMGLTMSGRKLVYLVACTALLTALMQTCIVTIISERKIMPQIRRYISGVSNRAYRDPLTHVRNKAAFTDTMEELRKHMDAGERDFALLMMDLNNLKEINDTYGHDCGDDYLISSCRMICQVFRHSPVFRIGGDEFVVLLQNEDLRNHESLLAELDRRMSMTQDEEEVWRRISIAKGIAFCTDKDDVPLAVFRRADGKMYRNKDEMKRSAYNRSKKTS